MARSAKFKAWQSKTGGKGFYFHVISGNSKTVAPSQRYPTHYEVMRATEQEWIAFAKALGVYGQHTVATFLATHPVPYTKDSLLPKHRPPMIPIGADGSGLVLKGFPGMHKALKTASKRIRRAAVKQMESRMKPTPAKVRKVAKKISRIAAVEKIIEGARIGMNLGVPKTASGKTMTLPSGRSIPLPMRQAMNEGEVKRRIIAAKTKNYPAKRRGHTVAA